MSKLLVVLFVSALCTSNVIHAMQFTSSPQEAVGFYNIFAKGPHFESIVQEQIQMMTKTGLIEKLDAVYYQTSGDEGLQYKINHTKFIHHAHVSGGSELDTLESMYNYCQSRPATKVLYLHTKGSFHASPANTKFRRLLDCFNLAPHCIQALDTYDTCGMRISPHPMPHYSGNFFWATCRHVKGLVDPSWYRTNDSFIAITDSLNECIASSGRYLAEAWVASAPVFKPADCLPVNVGSPYIWGYEFPAAIPETLCPNVHSGIYGSVCGNASSMTHPELFQPQIENLQAMMGRNRKTCQFDLHSEILKRSQMWYGVTPQTFIDWMKPLRVPPKIAENSAIRAEHSRQIYLFRNNELFAIPSPQIFIKLGFDFDNVMVVPDFVIQVIPHGPDAYA
eukprot:CAMPEP_0170381380 /NCGR_PEP_ID=MMETSP0117_2-20130122/14379_1 /TAXON_ID=400756 /ORGANISM="Durinskia baltica, Strain CSIRO CS-38" /LENGTH=392 /DNA_ID=CAMNT_0010636949 /DNA_START=212 /DNA_END=1390 /DNA_ORIENTATION=-